MPETATQPHEFGRYARFETALLIAERMVKNGDVDLVWIGHRQANCNDLMLFDTAGICYITNEQPPYGLVAKVERK